MKIIKRNITSSFAAGVRSISGMSSPFANLLDSMANRSSNFTGISVSSKDISGNVGTEIGPMKGNGWLRLGNDPVGLTSQIMKELSINS